MLRNTIRSDIHIGATVDIVLKKDQPTGILTAYNPSGHHFAAFRVAFADVGNIRKNFVIQCGHSG